MYKVVVHRLTDFSKVPSPLWMHLIMEIQIPKTKQWTLRVRVNGHCLLREDSLLGYSKKQGTNWSRTKCKSVTFEELIAIVEEYPNAVSLLVRELM